jgi:hypothetical protein
MKELNLRDGDVDQLVKQLKEQGKMREDLVFY